jgi:hypothetical protein
MINAFGEAIWGKGIGDWLGRGGRSRRTLDHL